jgi:hypothetical protein
MMLDPPALSTNKKLSAPHHPEAQRKGASAHPHGQQEKDSSFARPQVVEIELQRLDVSVGGAECSAGAHVRGE